MINQICNIVVLLALLLFSGCGRNVVTTQSLGIDYFLDNLTNISVFATTPEGTAAMLSSYDRTGGNNDWAILDKVDERGDPVVASLHGPGVMHRLWMTGIPTNQIVNFYFDGESTARISSTIGGLFGKTTPFLPPLCDNVSGGYYFYLPVPYSKSLTITLSKTDRKDDRRYFHINFETYPNNFSISSFPIVLQDFTLKHIEAVRKTWANSTNSIEDAAALCSKSSITQVSPHSRATVLDCTTGGVVRTFWLKYETSAKLSFAEREGLLRQLILRFYWDGMNSPSVAVPLGDFFCNPLHHWEFASMPLAVTADKFICRFPMYFAKAARVEIENISSSPLNVEMAFDVVPAGREAGRNYFHAMWNSASSPMMPHKILNASGKGHYVGCNLMEIGMDGSWNIFEGDECIFIDGADQPSHHGTGLEDYFNGGWYYAGLFSLPLHGLIEKAPIRSTQYRFHLADRVPFSSNAFMNIEFGDGNRTKGYMSSVAYWYQDRACPVADRDAVSWSAMPADPLEPTAIMSTLFELERSRRYDIAERRCYQYIENYPASPYNEMLRLRAITYRAQQDQSVNVLSNYQQFAEYAVSQEVKKQAGDLLWMHEKPGNTLLLTSFNGATSVFLDGNQILQGDDPLNLGIRRIILDRGEHTLAVEFKNMRSYAWMMAELRSTSKIKYKDCKWRVTMTKSSGWPGEDKSINDWVFADEFVGCPPFMPYWQFPPNAMVACQSVNFISPPAGWTDIGKILYFKRSFTIE